MYTVWLGIAFVYGCIIGSFLNVVILRLHTGRTLGGRSHCMTCGTQLRSRELVPLLSYLVQWGRCLTCTARISPQYALVEGVTGVLFAVLTAVFWGQYILLALYCIAVAALVVVVVYDIRQTIIPNEAVLVLTAISLMRVGYDLYTGASTFRGAGYALAVAAGASALFGLLWLLSRGRMFGLGDVKLMFPLSFMLGPVGTLSYIVLAFWVGTAYVALVAGARAVSVRFIHNRFSLPRYTMKSEVPFGPFLVIGFLLVLIFKIDVLATIQHCADAATLAFYAWFAH